MSDEDLGKAMRAVWLYENGMELPELSGMAWMLFTTIRRDLDRAHAISQVRSENGAKGGKSKAEASDEEAPVSKEEANSSKHLANASKREANSSKPSLHKTLDIDKDIPPLPPPGGKGVVFQFGFCVSATMRRAAESANRKGAPGDDFRGFLYRYEKLPFRGIKPALWGRTGPGIGIQARTRNRTREKKAFFLLPVDLRVVRPAEQIVYRAAEVIGYSSNRF